MIYTHAWIADLWPRNKTHPARLLFLFIFMVPSNVLFRFKQFLFSFAAISDAVTFSCLELGWILTLLRFGKAFSCTRLSLGRCLCTSLAERLSSNQCVWNNFRRTSSRLISTRSLQDSIMHFTLLKRIFSELPNSNTVFGARLSSSYSSKSHYFTSTTSLASIPRNTGHWKWPITNVRDPRSRGGSRMWYPPVNTKEDARNIALNLDPTGRKLLMEELKVIEEEKGIAMHSLEFVHH